MSKLFPVNIKKQ